MRPSTSGKTPVAIGSSVPKCPMDRSPTSRRILATTSWEVHPAGLSTTITPLTGILLLSCRFRGSPVKSPANCIQSREGTRPCRTADVKRIHDPAERRRAPGQHSVRELHVDRAEHARISVRVISRPAEPAARGRFRNGSGAAYGGAFQPWLCTVEPGFRAGHTLRTADGGHPAHLHFHVSPRLVATPHLQHVGAVDLRRQR